MDTPIARPSYLQRIAMGALVRLALVLVGVSVRTTETDRR